jgi:alpha-glucosidase
MLTLYRAALRLRHAEPALGAGVLLWRLADRDVLRFERTGERGGGPPVACVVNLGPSPVAMPAGQLLLASLPGVAASLPPDCAAWLRPG